MVIKGEAREKLYSVIADSIDVLRLYGSAMEMWKATKDELYSLQGELDAVVDYKRESQAQIAALEHTVSELNERNDRLEMKLDVANKYKDAFEMACATIRGAVGIPGLMNYLKARLCHGNVDVEIPGEDPTDAADGEQAEAEGWKIRARLAGQNALLEGKLNAMEAELEKYKVAVVELRDVIYRQLPHGSYASIMSKTIEQLKEKGYDIEHEKGHEIPEIASRFGSEDNSEGADEHDFL